MSFRDIKLQDEAVGILRRGAESGKLAPSLLFFGSSGVGKRLAAVTLAKALNCPVKGPSDCCDECPSCKKIETRNHPDVHIIGPEGAGSEIKIEKIREMRRSIALKAFEGKANIFIIERAHFLNADSANCLLKTLEEPPKNSFIILTTNLPERIFPTLRSRCQGVRFSPARPQDLKRLLMKEYNIKEEEAHFLSYLAQGRIGKALGMRDEGALKWKNEVLDRFSKKAIMTEDPFFVNKKRADTLDLIDVLIGWYRDMLIFQNGADESVLINIDRVDDIRAKAKAISRAGLEEILNEALKTRAYIEQNVNPKLALANLALAAEQ